MVVQLPDTWQAGLSALLAAETEQRALEVAVMTIAGLLNGPAVGVLKGRAEHLISVVAQNNHRYVAPLFVEALWTADPRLAGSESHYQALFDDKCVVSVLLRDNRDVIGAISVLIASKSMSSESPYISILELAFVRTVQRIRRLAETHLLYEISLRLGSTLDLHVLLREVLGLTAATFSASVSRIFLYDERMGDLLMTPGPNSQPSNGDLLRIPLEGTLAGWVVCNGCELVQNSVADGDVPVTAEETGLNAGKVICVPLKHADRILGALMLANQRDDPDFLDEDLRLLTTVAGTIAIMIANARLYQRAIRDALTGAYNRGAFDNMLQDCWVAWQAHGTGFALILLDLDDFKQINDRFGHLTGDMVLQSVTRLLWETLRGEDSIFRYGGEEFGVLLTGLTDPTVVMHIAERLRAALDRELVISNLVRVKLAASVGVAMHPLHGIKSTRALLDLADDAAYRAKHAGKNRVVMAPLPESVV